MGKEHPNTLRSVYRLAHLRHRRKQYKDASALHERSYTGFHKALGIDHPITLAYIEACLDSYSSMIEEMKGQASV